MLNRRWAIVAGLAVVELWIVGLILRSLTGGHGTEVAAAPPLPLASFAPGNGGAAQTVDTGSTPLVVIDDGDAALSITVRPGATVSIQERTRGSGWMYGDRHPVNIERTAGGVRISAGTDGGASLFIGSVARQIDVVVPPQARLDVRNAASTTVAGLRADASFHSDDGPITVSDHRGIVRVTTDNGRIELHDVDAPSIETHSDDGRITFANVRAAQVSVVTANGRIEIGQSRLGGGRIATDNGRVELGLDPQSDVTISAQASSGKVIAALPLVVMTAGADDDAPATIRIGTGAGRLEVGSENGSISIRAGGATNVSDNAVAALAVFCIFGAPIAAFVIMRVLAHRERIEMIRRGMIPPQAYRNAKLWQPSAGVPPPAQPAPAWVPGPSDMDSPDRSLRKGIMLALIGFAILIGLSFIGADTNGPMNAFEIHPGPWLLGGLIPMFVGIAQIIVALLSGARLGPPPRAAEPPPPYPGPKRSAPDSHYEPEPRTHSGFDELKRPTPPPDRR